MLLKRIYFLTVLFFVSSPGYGQDMTGKDLKDHMLIEMSKKTDRSVTEFEGSPFLSEQFVAGTVYSSNKKYGAIPLRYNIFNDNMEFQQNSTIYALYPEPRVTKVILGSETYVVEKHEVKGKMVYGYMTRLDSGKMTMLAKKIVRFTERKEAKALESSATPAKFTRIQDDYFYKIGNGEVAKISSLKNLIESLPDKRDELASYSKKEKLSTRSEEDLKKLSEYYNSL
jgi:hypothetical protein